MAIRDRADELLCQAYSALEDVDETLRAEIYDYLFSDELSSGEFAEQHLSDEEITYYEECRELSEDAERLSREIKEEDGGWDWRKFAY